MNRRSFLQSTFGVAGALAARRVWGATGAKATDVVYLGPDKIKLTRLAMGTGTKGGSRQRLLGMDGLADLLHFGYDQNLFFWETADLYKTHPAFRLALKRVPREKVTIMTKSSAKTAEEMRADLDRFRLETSSDYFDIVLLHACRTPTWPDERKGAMEALSEAKQKGIVRSHGVSCHSIEAMQTAVKTPWVHVDLARINPAKILMDGDPPAIVSVLRQLKAAGKGTIGMKILGEGQLKDRKDEALKFAMSLDCLDCFTIGCESRDEVTDLLKRIPAAAAA